MLKNWSIPLVTVYLYAVSVISQFGYNSEYMLPTGSIDASIQYNISYFYVIVRYWIPSALIIFVPLIMWSAFVGFLYIRYPGKKMRIATTVLIFATAFGSLVGFEKIGTMTAKTQHSFLMVSNECIDQTYSMYVVPVVNNSVAVMVPIVSSTTPGRYTHVSGFIVRDITALPCKLEHRDIGTIF